MHRRTLREYRPLTRFPGLAPASTFFLFLLRQSMWNDRYAFVTDAQPGGGLRYQWLATSSRIVGQGFRVFLAGVVA